ncbi:SDR family NAD(P)-dependent oxidoreductase [Paracoccaceae bacterium]|nr:SDR family NAD(P)-dependent oxidoreductase [Paracoccaceae bacterium]
MITHKDTAIITGGAQGIGLACAKRLAANGSKLVLLDTDEAALTQAKDQLPNVPLRLLSVDITNYEAVQNAIKDITFLLHNKIRDAPDRPKTLK